ncbi:MAG: site-2 protease family protein [Thermoguttaceae bacterium]
MLLSDPPRSGGDLNFQLLGIPVRVHPFFWLIAVMLGLGPDTQAAELLIWVVAVFLSVLIHELGHALAMRAFGIWPWITLYGFGGLTSYNPAEARNAGSLGQVLISFAGPGSQFLYVAALAAILWGLGYDLLFGLAGPLPLVLPAETVVSWGLTRLLSDLMLVGIAWGLLNLIPVYPLDGGHIAREIFLALSPRNGISMSLVLSIVAGAFVAMMALAQKDVFLGLMFGMLAYGSYTTLRAYGNQRGW